MSIPAEEEMDDGKNVLGTGLSLPLYAAIVVFSVTLFLVWGGPLWTAPRTASHVARFAVSYAAVVPVAAALLLGLGRFSWTRLITTTTTSWGIKLVVTSTLYFALAPSTAAHLEAAAPPAHRPASEGSASYEAAPTAFNFGTLRGSFALKPGQHAIVYLEAPSAGLASSEEGTVALSISASSYDAALALVHNGDRVAIKNNDATLHTAHIYREGRSVENTPIPAGTQAVVLRSSETGVHEIRCDNHPDERTTLLVVDHPYATLLGEDGQFQFDRVPTGSVKVRLLVVSAGASDLDEETVSVRAGETSTLVLKP